MIVLPAIGKKLEVVRIAILYVSDGSLVFIMIYASMMNGTWRVLLLATAPVQDLPSSSFACLLNLIRSGGKRTPLTLAFQWFSSYRTPR